MYFSTASVSDINSELQGRLDGTLEVATPVTQSVKKMSPDLFDKAAAIIKNRNIASKYKKPAVGTRESFEQTMRHSDEVLAEAQATIAEWKHRTVNIRELTEQSESLWCA